MNEPISTLTYQFRLHQQQDGAWEIQFSRVELLIWHDTGIRHEDKAVAESLMVEYMRMMKDSVAHHMEQLKARLAVKVK